MSSGTPAAGRSERAPRSLRFWALGLAAALLVAVPAAAVAAFVIMRDAQPPDPPTAVIVDQLSLTAPNPDFARQATELLEAAGYGVDYYPGEQVTVDLYQKLPKHGYDVVLVRAHAGRHQSTDGQFTDETALFTAETYSTTSWVEEQRDGLVTQVLYDENGGESYFGIAPAFVRYRMDGDFDGANVILMGCDVLRGELLAQAFVDRGAGAVVGWDAPVSADHTDAATLSLLRHYLSDGMSAQEAAAAAMDDVGPDPYYGARLLSEPPQASR